MTKKSWVFNEKRNVMVLTTKKIINSNELIKTVYHDEEDGMWQFLDGTDITEDGAMVVGLEEVVEIDKSVEEVSDLPLGWVAWREEKGRPWFRRPQE
jgi:hypothetical protein